MIVATVQPAGGQGEEPDGAFPRWKSLCWRWCWHRRPGGFYILPTPLAGGQKKSFAEQMNFFSGVGMIFFDPVSNFQCATPRGLIRVPTVGCNLPQIAPLVDAILQRAGRALPHNIVNQRKSLDTTLAMVHPDFYISRFFKFISTTA